jgi:hypothetical protein
MEDKIFSNINNKNNNLDIDGIDTFGKKNQPFKIDNFSLNEITKKYSDDEFTKNILNDEKKFLISVNDKLNKFSVLDQNNTSIGYFTIHHIAKYLGDYYDKKSQYLKNLDINVYKKAKELIKTLLFKINYNIKNNYADIILHDYLKSGFMGDIELLIKLNNQLYKYTIESMQHDLAYVDFNNRQKIEQNIKKFMFMMLNYTLKLIAIVSEQIKDNDAKKELKEHLVNYSIGIVYRINIFVQEQLKIINNQNKIIKESLDSNLEIKNVLKNKLDILINNIQKEHTPYKQKHNIKLHNQTNPQYNTMPVDPRLSQNNKPLIYEYSMPNQNKFY